jgi:hypothetical protein
VDEDVAAIIGASPPSSFRANDEVLGLAVITEDTVIESVAAAVVIFRGTEILCATLVTPAARADGVPSVTVVGYVALEGTTESIPKPKAATATSAMRLIVVFVDICFLSISRSEEFPPFGLGSKNAFSYVMRGHS